MGESQLLEPSLETSPGDAAIAAGDWREIDALIAAGRRRPGALIPVLTEIQKRIGYLPEAVQRRVARGLGIPLSQVYGVVSFYSFFTMKPRPKHIVRLCLGTACHVAGAGKVLAEFEHRLHCRPGENSADGLFGLEVIRCLGACGLSPVVHIDEETHSQVRPGQVESLLRRCQEADGTAAEEAVLEATS